MKFSSDLVIYDLAGCEKIYQEKISGTTKNRPELDKMIEQLREGDELYV